MLDKFTDDQKRTFLDLGQSYLLFRYHSRISDGQFLYMGDPPPGHELVDQLSDEELKWLVDLALLETEASNAGSNGDHERSIELFKKVLDLAPWNSIAIMSLGVQYAFLGQGKKAIAFLERASHMDLDNQQIKKNLRAIQEDFGRGY